MLLSSFGYLSRESDVTSRLPHHARSKQKRRSLELQVHIARTLGRGRVAETGVLLQNTARRAVFPDLVDEVPVVSLLQDNGSYNRPGMGTQTWSISRAQLERLARFRACARNRLLL